MEIVLATLNLHKIREFREMLQNIRGVEILSLHSFLNYTPPPETGDTFRENAVEKAEHAALALNAWVIADDSGLVVPRLNGAPGVYSRRYSGEHATDAENNRKLLQEMQGLEGIARSAYYVCGLAIANPSGLQKYVEARCEGWIQTSERGTSGFGYDSLFVKHEYAKTFGELEEAVKNKVSHRRKAIDGLLPFLSIYSS